jgi:hypothetical protein
MNIPTTTTPIGTSQLRAGSGGASTGADAGPRAGAGAGGGEVRRVGERRVTTDAGADTAPV